METSSDDADVLLQALGFLYLALRPDFGSLENVASRKKKLTAV